MCRFWAGGISSFPFSRAREYRLLRRLRLCQLVELTVKVASLVLIIAVINHVNPNYGR
jgi:hypothetical protein